MTAHQGARARARAEITAEIIAEARRQLATDGAAGLSLRSVARELGMVSSAVYRYVESRDDLLTRLIIEAYDGLGAVAEHAARSARGAPPADRFVAVASAIRAWARANEHEYALVYGSPVPGYAAPEDTIAPASRVSIALASVVVDAWRDGSLHPTAPESTDAPPDALADDLTQIALAIGADADLPHHIVIRLLAAWTQIFGLISFELFGQTSGLVHAHDDLFQTTTNEMARFIGLPG